jgi:hypothetical protein
MVASYAVSDLVEAWADADVHRVVMIARAFGLLTWAKASDADREWLLPRAAEPGPDDDYLVALLLACGRSRESSTSPFREFLEGPDVIIALYQRFGRRLDDVERAGDRDRFRATLDELTLTAAAQLWQLEEAATTEVSVRPQRPVGEV